MHTKWLEPYELDKVAPGTLAYYKQRAEEFALARKITMWARTSQRYCGISTASHLSWFLISAVGRDAPVAFRSAAPEDILAWRERVARKYREELAEELTWDEGSPFEVSDDIGTHEDVMLHYVAAVLDQRGLSEISRMIEVGEPASEALNAAFAEAERRKFGGRFPHLLLGANVWLPYKRPLMIEEPDWEARRNRFGSTLHLFEDELTAVRSAIVEAQPSVRHSPASETSSPALVAAWQASNTIVRLAKIAVAQHLPLWTTG
jgi:hypothetical protein